MSQQNLSNVDNDESDNEIQYDSRGGYLSRFDPGRYERSSFAQSAFARSLGLNVLPYSRNFMDVSDSDDYDSDDDDSDDDDDDSDDDDSNDVLNNIIAPLDVNVNTDVLKCPDCA